MLLRFLMIVVINLGIDATHFQGGTISYKVVGNNVSGVIVRITQSYTYAYSRIYCDNNYIANQLALSLTSYPDASETLTCVANCLTSGGYTPIPVTPRCTDFSSGMDITVGQRTDDVVLDNGSYFHVAFQSSAWRNLSLPTGGTTKTWSLSTLIDLRLRSDGTWNTPPMATMISPIFIPAGVLQTITIPTIDADDDNVRCRFANGTNECGTVCPPSSLPSGTSISTNCVVSITGANAGDWYAVTVQVEDFADAASPTPYSSVPVQFLIYVYDQPVCTQRPYLYSQNPTGSCVGVQVGTPYTLLLIVENYCANYNVTMIDIATQSFPIVLKSNIVQNTTTLWSVTLKWTPTANQVGSQIFCSVAVDSTDVQSNQYCLTFTVGNGTMGVCPGETTTTTLYVRPANIFQLKDAEIFYRSTSSDISVDNSTSTSANGTTTTVVIIVVPIVVVLISFCGCCCCCCCWSKSKSTVEVEKIEDVEQQRSVKPSSKVNDSFSSSNWRNSSQKSDTFSYPSTAFSLSTTDNRSLKTQSSSKSQRRFPRWMSTLSPPIRNKVASSQTTRSVGIVPRHIIYD